MPKLIDLTGKQFGMLTVSGHAGVNAHRQHRWHCLCKCGNAVIVIGHHLRQGSSQSCGCTRGEKHGLRQSRAYRIWSLMCHRCSNPNSPGWKYYGGRGIRVEECWLKFSGFFRDMGHPPPGTSLERINVNGDYGPSNCRWATRIEQANNKRSNRIVLLDGRMMTLASACREVGVNYKTAHTRLSRGSSVATALRAK